MANQSEHEVLESLVQQIEINDFVDSHGHTAKMLKAFLDAKQSLQPQPQIEQGLDAQQIAHELLAEAEADYLADHYLWLEYRQKMEAELTSAEARCKVLEKALKFYSDFNEIVHRYDNGRTARQALSPEPKEE